MKRGLVMRIIGFVAGAWFVYEGISIYKNKEDMALTRWGPDISIGIGVIFMAYSIFSRNFASN